jgi:hypothetical protein
VTLSIIERLLAVHIDIKHPIMHPEVVLVSDAVTSHPNIRLVLPLSDRVGIEI